MDPIRGCSTELSECLKGGKESIGNLKGWRQQFAVQNRKTIPTRIYIR